MSESVNDFRSVFRACVVNAVREGEALMAQLIAVTREAWALFKKTRGMRYHERNVKFGCAA